VPRRNSTHLITVSKLFTHNRRLSRHMYMIAERETHINFVAPHVGLHANLCKDSCLLHAIAPLEPHDPSWRAPVEWGRGALSFGASGSSVGFLWRELSWRGRWCAGILSWALAIFPRRCWVWRIFAIGVNSRAIGETAVVKFRVFVGDGL
jgi:hypothetical protein